MANEVLTTNIKHLLGSLVAQGVHEFVVSPGSRTTPFALLLAEMQHVRDDVRVTVDVDERSAAFFALGMAKTMHQPVALLATSGTATANYLPAMMEAHVSHVPLIALTTDRPAELQAIGAPQTVNQTNLYGDNIKYFVAVEMQDAHADVTRYIDYRVQQMVVTAVTAPAGPVQINLPLRKPLMPDLGATWPAVVAQHIITSQTRADWQTVQGIAALLRDKRAMVLAGPDEMTWDATQFERFADHFKLPILADVLSGVRPSDHAINGIDALLEADVLADDLVPEVVIRFGGTPVSARVVAWLRANDVQVIQVGQNAAGHDHSRQAEITVAVDEMGLIADLLAEPGSDSVAFLARWQTVKTTLTKTIASTDMTEVALPLAMTSLPADSQLFVANSMPIRDMDNYFMPTQAIRVMANRGANGIDGTVSTAFGMAMTGKPTTFLTGDLTLFHDMNGLMMAHQAQLDLTIVVVNNQGGGIFSFLPQAAAKAFFEPMFGTPLPFEIADVAKLYHADYELVADQARLRALLAQPAQGLRLLEIKSNREANVAEHDALLAKLREAFHG